MLPTKGCWLPAASDKPGGGGGGRRRRVPRQLWAWHRLTAAACPASSQNFASDADPERAFRLKTAEIKHARLAMVAFFGGCLPPGRLPCPSCRSCSG